MGVAFGPPHFVKKNLGLRYFFYFVGGGYRPPAELEEAKPKKQEPSHSQ